MVRGPRFSIEERATGVFSVERPILLSMAKLFAIGGIGWATFGVISLVTMSRQLANDPGGMAAFGLLLDWIVFIIPGSVVAILAGIMIWRRNRKRRRG